MRDLTNLCRALFDLEMNTFRFHIYVGYHLYTTHLTSTRLVNMATCTPAVLCIDSRQLVYEIEPTYNYI